MLLDVRYQRLQSCDHLPMMLADCFSNLSHYRASMDSILDGISGLNDFTKPLQHSVIEAVTRRVDDWRGFALGHAQDACPSEARRYKPAADGEQGVSETTMALLQHWFRREPHIIGVEPHTRTFKYWPHQRRLVETFIYLYEVAGIRRTEELYRFAGVAASPFSRRRPGARQGRKGRLILCSRTFAENVSNMRLVGGAE